MVREGTAFFSESGMIFRTMEEAEKQDALDKAYEFEQAVLTKLGRRKEHMSYLMTRDAAQLVFEHANEFVSVLRQFGFIGKEV